MTTRSEPMRGGDHRLLMLILAIGVQIALLGAYLGGRMVFGGASSASTAQAGFVSASTGPGAGGYGIASDVRTSFGSVVVGTAQSLPGLTRRSLAGNNHGIGGYVPPDKVQVQVTVEITNRLRTPIPYSPSQFSLISGTAKPIPVTGSSIKPATLLPDAAVEATLIFVAPRKGQTLKLAFQDRGRATPFLIDLGRVDTAPKGSDAHSHP
jgi:hypothetical protein